ncbi:Ppx/GppA family phosphatase [Clostridium sp. 'deep sea']|uniref:Ppx/GppA phosphatase family protein n=1 Tax=Clostridium sp. 'deep sea' TaxID=2779445 RepID=UPI0018966C62|nr:Ppx/GppA phosphatase family protein [Clostridium sp. 'deep sea']QOR34522.1 Ppx/GppA family phosphatase [Clostridium sp. 'deep sea']
MYQQEPQKKDKDMRYSVIDCGSNSFRMVVVEVINNKIVELYRDLKMVQLGADLTASGGIINKDTEERCILALQEFKNMAINYACQEIYCVGTSALRSASNSLDFCQAVSFKTGINIKVIRGEQEAWYSYCGATESKKLIAGVAVLDIGGGSTEVAITTKEKILSSSIKAGSVRLTNMFADNNKQIQLNEFLKLKQYVKDLWHSYWNNKKLPISRFIGVAGTITTLSAIKLKMEQYEPNRINGSSLTYNQILGLYNKLNDLTVEQRLKLTGLKSKKRAEIIVAGTAILLATLEYWQQSELEIRDNSLLQGVIFDKIIK